MHHGRARCDRSPFPVSLPWSRATVTSQNEQVVSRDDPTPEQAITIGEEAAEELTDQLLSRFLADDDTAIEWIRLASIALAPSVL